MTSGHRSLDQSINQSEFPFSGLIESFERQNHPFDALSGARFALITDVRVLGHLSNLKFFDWAVSKKFYLRICKK